MKFQWEFSVIVALLVFEAADSQETCSGPSKIFSLSKDDLEDPSRFLDEVRSWVDEVTNKPTTSTPEVSTTTTEISNTLSPGTASGNATLTGSYASTSTDTTTATKSEAETTTDSTTTTSLNAVDSSSTSSHDSNSEGGATATPSQEDASYSTVTNIFSTPPTEGYTTTTTNAFTTITSKVDAITTNILASSASDTTTNAEVSPTHRSQKTTNFKPKPDFSEVCKTLRNDYTFCYRDKLNNKSDVNYTTAENICQGNSRVVASILNGNEYNLGLLMDIRGQFSKGSIWVWAGTTPYDLPSFSMLSPVGGITYTYRISCYFGPNSEKRVALHIHTTEGVDINCMEPSFRSQGVICQPDLNVST